MPTLAALVSGATTGLVSEVLVADGGSRDDTAAVADVAGCNFMPSSRARWAAGSRPRRRSARAVADVPAAGHRASTRRGPARSRRFVERPASRGYAAVFRRGAAAQPALREVLSLLAAALGALPRPEQGLLIAKPFYDALGGHSERAADPETELIRRIGRRAHASCSTTRRVPGQILD